MSTMTPTNSTTSLDNLELKPLLFLSNPLSFGLVAALVHHVCVQYPRQKPLFYTFRAMGLANAIFAGVLLTHEGPGTSPMEWLTRLKSLVIFNLTFVNN